MSNKVRLTLESAFWVSAALISYTYLGYPMLMYLRSRFRPRRWTQAPIAPTVSIIMAVHNGAAVLRQKIEHLLSLNYPPDRTELIVVSDGSTDDTARILQEYHHPRLKVIVCDEHRGKAAALNSGVSRAIGELLVFVDIRPWLERDALPLLLSNFADPQVGCAAGELVLQNDDHEAAAKVIGGLYWRYEQWIRNSEAQVDSPVGVYGGFYAVRRQLAKSFPEGLILDDMFQPLNVIRQGYRSVLDQRAHVYDSWPKSTRGEFSRKVRTLAGNFQLLQLQPWLLSRSNRLCFELVSHKVLRLFVPVWLSIMLCSTALLVRHSNFYEVALALQIGFYVLAMLGFGRGVPFMRRVAGIPNAFCMLNAAAVVAFWKFAFDRAALSKLWVASTPVKQLRIREPEHQTPAEVSNGL